MFVYVLLLFFAILNVFAKPFLHNPNGLRIETPRPNVKLLVPDDTHVTGCSSQPSSDSLDEDQGKASLQKRSDSCQTNENGRNPYHNLQVQPKPDSSSPTNTHGIRDICPHPPYNYMVSCSTDAQYDLQPNNVRFVGFTKIFIVYVVVYQCRAGKPSL